MLAEGAAMKHLQRLAGLSACCVLGMLPAATAAQTTALPPLRIGLIMSFTGGTGWVSKQSPASVNAWIKLHGDTVAGRKVIVITRDEASPRRSRAGRPKS